MYTHIVYSANNLIYYYRRFSIPVRKCKINQLINKPRPVQASNDFLHFFYSASSEHSCKHRKTICRYSRFIYHRRTRNLFSLLEEGSPPSQPRVIFPREPTIFSTNDLRPTSTSFAYFPPPRRASPVRLTWIPARKRHVATVHCVFRIPLRTSDAISNGRVETRVKREERF